MMGNMRVRVRRLGVAVVVSALGAVALSSSGYGAVESCTYNAGTKTVTATVTSGSAATLKVVGDQLWFGFVPAPCGAATTTNTNSISIAGEVGTTERLILDHSGGAFGPGFTSESNIPEIEIATALGDFADTIVLIGTSGNDTFASGQNGLALNTDGDLDVTLSPNPLHLEAYMGDGNDYFNGRGQGGAGLRFLGPIIADAGTGNDELVGSARADVLTGGDGNDVMRGDDDVDLMYGGPGADNLQGSNGNDLMDGGTGADSFSAGYGNDTMIANDEEADTAFNGGGDTDTLHYDAGIDPSASATEVLVPYSPPPPPPPPAGCTYDAATKTVTASLDAGTSGTLAVSGGAIQFGATPAACGAATTANTDSITISGQAGSTESLTIDQSGGAFAPGATAESGSSEIEIAVSLGDASDAVTIMGTNGPDAITLGSKGIALNVDTDVDVTFAQLPSSVTISGLGGPNTLKAVGGFGAGTVWLGQVTLVAGSSGDTLEGGNGNDTLTGGDGNDVLNGGSGNDLVNGGGGNDSLNGSHGDDDLTGGTGADSFTGGTGNDVMRAGDDFADTSISGGAGADTAYYDQGTDPTPSAETQIPD
jgi:Ca2+-binding RTX toxin-like protein